MITTIKLIQVFVLFFVSSVFKRFSFLVSARSAVADRQALLQFLVCAWLVRIANVLGCVCWYISYSNLILLHCLVTANLKSYSFKSR